MKKPLFILILVALLGSFFYYYYSAPRIIDRRLDSLLDSLTFGVITLQEKGKSADQFADHFSPTVRFSGAGNDIIAGSPSREDLREMYLEQLRAFAKGSKAERSGDTSIALESGDRAVMSTAITLQIETVGNTSYTQEMPCRLVWQKESGTWRISEVQLQKPVNEL